MSAAMGRLASTWLATSGRDEAGCAIAGGGPRARAALRERLGYVRAMVLMTALARALGSVAADFNRKLQFGRSWVATGAAFDRADVGGCRLGLPPRGSCQTASTAEVVAETPWLSLDIEVWAAGARR
jgi:hypothetical protein